MIAIRVPIRVRPGAGRHKVGGSAGDPPRLLVAVCSQAVDGKATEAALSAVAEAVGVKRRDVSLVSGTTSRDKLVEIQGDVVELSAAVERLMSV
ncbi:MAG: hypothetical protein RIS75_744 [Actinomycetota bacterium]|jgi:uncharacterized protein YggU (UPF0235/DUF167 family)